MPSKHTLPKLEGVTNFRELGGLQTRDGQRVRARRVFRSGHWGGATASDQALMRELEIGRVFDFRSQVDLSYDGQDKLPEEVEHIALPTSDPAMIADVRKQVAESGRKVLYEIFGEGRAAEFMCLSASRLVTECVDTYGGFLSKLAEPGSPAVLFHCSAGKDRAGWAASCLLLALGVEEEAVVEHYLLSNEYYEPTKQGFAKMDPELVELLRPLSGVRAEYVQASIEAASERFGSLDGYFREGLRLTDSQFEQLARNWLED